MSSVIIYLWTSDLRTQSTFLMYNQVMPAPEVQEDRGHSETETWM